MLNYTFSIEMAFLIFPFIAFVFTIPYLIYQYHKFGSIPAIRSLIVYSFILYLICAYFLIILPLPKISDVAKMTGSTMQLKPFGFVQDILKETSLTSSGVLAIIKNHSVYTIIFNLLLLIPFGIYLKYYFEKKWYEVIIYSFLLSLFFELTQLSGLYGIYPRSYRLFDVDDLLINTLGGTLGFIISPILEKILPSKTKLDETSYKNSKNITLTRRIMAFLIDLFCIIVIYVIMTLLFSNTFFNKYIFLIVLLIYYLIIPLFTEGVTVGKKIVHLKIVDSFSNKAKYYQIFFRYLLGCFFFIYFPYTYGLLKSLIKSTPINSAVIFGLLLFYILNVISVLKSLFRKNKLLLYEKITKTKSVNTINYIENVE